MVNVKTSNDSGKKYEVSYWSKEKVACPVCRKQFEREIMRSGNGRMIAGSLTDELHRNFEPSAKYGRVYPLIYEVGCCPHCYTAMFWNDFKEKMPKDDADKLFEHSEDRRQVCENIFPNYSLTKKSTLYEGVAKYLFALMTYNDLNANFLPTMKSAIISLRLAWLTHDMDLHCANHNFDIVSKVFYSKALFFYQQAVINESARTEKSSTLPNMGPDMDKNYGWDGVIYLCGLLEYKYGQQDDIQLRMKKLSESKTAIARIFGLGKSSKNKPGPLLEHARNLYDNLSKILSDDEF